MDKGLKLHVKSSTRPVVALSALSALVLAIGVWWLATGTPLLRNVTGEEQLLPQVRGVGHLISGWLRPYPRTGATLPVSNVGMNPFCVNTFLQNEVEPAKVERAMQLVQQAGFTWIRQEFPWEDIEIHGKGDFEDRRNPPTHSAWDKYDRIVDLAARYHVRIIARLSNPPAWSRAKGDAAGPMAPPDNLDDYGDFVEAVVRHFQGRIHTYQIWNEPNIYPEWGNQPVSPEGYTALLRVAYTRAKAVDPTVVILSAPLAPTIELTGRDLNDFLFLQRMYDAGARDYFDVLSVQDYGLWSGPLDRRMRPRVLNFSRPMYIRDIMIRNGDGNKAIWASEVGWNSTPEGVPANYGRTSEALRARYAAEAFRRAQDEWPWMGVMCYWFLKQADDHEKNQSQYYFRLLEPDFTPLPAYQALREEAHRSPALGVGYHPPDHYAMSYHGSWKKVSTPEASVGYTQAGDTGDWLSFRFHGDRLDFSFLAAAQSGRVQAQVDDRSPVVWQTGKGGPAATGDHHTIGGLGNGEHTVTLTVLEGPVSFAGLTVHRSWW